MTYSYTSQSDNVGLIEPELIRVLVNPKWKIIKSSVTGKTNFLREPPPNIQTRYNEAHWSGKNVRLNGIF